MPYLGGFICGLALAVMQVAGCADVTQIVDCTGGTGGSVGTGGIGGTGGGVGTGAVMN